MTSLFVATSFHGSNRRMPTLIMARASSLRRVVGLYCDDPVNDNVDPIGAA